MSKSFRSEHGENSILKDADFELYPGEKASLIGPSGSGKSTLLALISGLLRPDSGTVEFNGTKLNTMNEAEQSALRARYIGIALQAENLIPFLTARENVELAFIFGGQDKQPADAQRLLERFGVGHVSGFKPRHISGGESQRVSLAVALANNPKLLIADEMTAQLDVKSASSVMKEVFESDMAVIFVTHSTTLAELAKRRFCIHDKKVVYI